MNIELLISEGHSFGEIKKYSFPQLLLFSRLIGQRWAKEAEAIEKSQKGLQAGSKMDDSVTVKGQYLPPRKLASLAEKKKQVARPAART